MNEGKFKPGDILGMPVDIKPNYMNLAIVNNEGDAILIHGSNTGLSDFRNKNPTSRYVKIGTVKELSDVILKEVFKDGK